MTDLAYKNASDIAKSAIAYGAEEISKEQDRSDAHEYIGNIPDQDWKTEEVSIANITPQMYEKAHEMVDKHYDKKS